MTKLPAASEKAFREQVRALANVLGWSVYFTWCAVHSPAGFPDLVLARERIIFGELKSEKGKPTAAQMMWLERLSDAGGECYLWRPSDFDNIKDILQRKRT